MTPSQYRICNRCVMDTSAGEIEFDGVGNCNFCEMLVRQETQKLGSSNSSQSLNLLIEKVKKDGLGKDYDCVIGVSGGVDSSWVLVQAVANGLRPLAVHMDNGWNSELATNNISNLIERLDVDLFTHVIEWEEYRDLMEAFFRADVIDIELLYDNAMTEVCYMKAREFGLKYILSGSNTATEGLQMPSAWAYGDKWDGANILSIASATGVNITTFPLFTNTKWLYSKYFKGIQWIPFLDYIGYEKETALLHLKQNFAYKPYPYKHYENIFTRFYQGYILPTKFNVDKRRVHFSSLIMSGQMDRHFALTELKKPAFSSADELRMDVEYFLKKMQWDSTKLEQYLIRPRREHSDYKTDKVRKYLWPVLRFTGRTRVALQRLLR
jgi:N-acetyl sugar amidotransferase